MRPPNDAARTARLPLTVIVVASVAVAFAVRVPFFFWPLTVDEAGYAYGARWWFDGVTMYSDELWFDRPQGIFLAYQSGMAFLGGSTEAIRIIGAAWSMVTTAGIVLVSSRMFNLRIAAIAGPLFAVLSAAPLIDGYVSNAEVFMIAASTLSAYFMWRKRWFTAGLLVGVAVLLKPSGGAALVFGLLWLLQLRAPRRDWLALVAGTALPLLLAFLHGVITVGADDYLYATVFFRLSTGGEGDPLVQLFEGWSKVTPVILPLVLVVVFGARGLRKWPTQYRFLSLWAATASLGVALGGNWWEHYFLQVIPPLTVMVAVVVDAAAVAVRDSTLVPLRFLRRVPSFNAAVLAGTVASIAAAGALVAPWAVMDPVEGSSRLYDMTGYQRNEEIAEYLAARTGPDDEIFIGLSHASLVYLTGRKSSTPYLYKQQTSEIPGALADIVDDLRAGTPAYVLVIPTQLEMHDPSDSIRDALDERYVYERSFWSAEVWRRR